jgi:hypothetical protein
MVVGVMSGRFNRERESISAGYLFVAKEGDCLREYVSGCV